MLPRTTKPSPPKEIGFALSVHKLVARQHCPPDIDPDRAPRIAGHKRPEGAPNGEKATAAGEAGTRGSTTFSAHFNKGSECHRERAGTLRQRVTVRFLRSALTQPSIGHVPVVRRVASSVGPAGARAALAPMRKQRSGRIVNVGSGAAESRIGFRLVTCVRC